MIIKKPLDELEAEIRGLLLESANELAKASKELSEDPLNALAGDVEVLAALALANQRIADMLWSLKNQGEKK